ncbi:hypothetical protein CASFOL_002670 [Castilleja foliolosa]|uniref:BHLH domain-containing protein n=1 Tax=Castilleja foliolosa TaxID=1961234 RepID=A0ABD3EIF0_9LAMI
MERVEDEIGTSIQPHNFASDFGLIDFMDETRFDQFIDQIFPPVDQLFNFDYSNINNIPSLIGLQNAIQEKAGDDNDEEEIMDENESSATTDGPAKKNGNKADRSRTLVSERKRRGRMKDKLYALRSLVPNITKLDKASIVGDAVLYVQELQTQAKRLKAEIAGLESSLTGGDKFKAMSTTSLCPMIKMIIKMDVFQVEERGFYVRIVSNKGKGVAVSLFKALESLTSFTVHTSNMAAYAQTYVFTFTLHIMEEGVDVNLDKLDLWIAGVFLNQGFEFETSKYA